MASIVNSSYAGLPIEHTVPKAGDVAKSLSASDILVGRRRVRFQPQTGTTVGSATVSAANQIIQWVLSDSTGLLDTNSLVLSYTQRTYTGTAGTAAMDDGAPFRRVQVSVNGQLADDVDNCQRNMNSQIYASANMDWYRTTGSFANYWTMNPDIGGGAVWGDLSGNIACAAARSEAGQDVAVPLGLLSGFFRQQQYIPLFALGELVVSLTCASNAEAIVQRGATDATYALSDIYIECDIVQPHHVYLDMMNALTQNDSESGISLAYESTIVSQGVSNAATAASFIVSRATNNLRRVVFTHTPTNALSSLAYPNTSCFPKANINSLQLRCGSLYFPAQPATSAARMWAITQSAFGEPNNLGSSGVVNCYLYNNTTTVAGATSNALSKAGGGAGTANRFTWADKFIFAYCFDNYKNSNEPLDIDGISVLNAAGSQVVVQVGYSAAPTDAVTPNISLIATRYLLLKSGSIQIVGA